MPSTAERSSAPLGVTLAPSKTISIPDLIELVLLAERLGYDSFWLPETWGADASTLLAVLAVRTERITLAAGVFNVYSRSAALLAQTASTLQNLSGGRFILGLGSSGPGVVERWHGVRFERPVDRMREYADVIRMALAGERVEYTGYELTLSGFRLSLLPTTPISIYVAALGPRNVRMVGEKADGWLPIFFARGQMESLKAQLADGARAAGRNPDEIRCASYIPCIVGSRGERLLREQLAYYIGGMGRYYAAFMSEIGFSEEVSGIRVPWQAGDRIMAAKAVDEVLLDACTLGQDAGIARGRLEAYRRDGVDEPVLALPNGCTANEARETLLALAPNP